MFFEPGVPLRVPSLNPNLVRIPRLLILAPPGGGKTTLLREIARRYRTGGLILDPIQEVGDIGIRWERRIEWTYEPEDSDEELENYAKRLFALEAGDALLVDEAGRFLPNDPGYRSRPLFQVLDLARNHGIPFALAEKRPTRLPSEITDLASTIAFRPWNSPAARRWLSGAGLEPDLPPLPLGRWYLFRDTELAGESSGEEISSRFGASSDMMR